MLVCNKSNQPLLISNTDQSDKHGTLWRSIHNLHRKKNANFLFDFLGIAGLLLFRAIKKLFKNILSGLENLKQTDNKLTLV